MQGVLIPCHLFTFWIDEAGAQQSLTSFARSRTDQDMNQGTLLWTALNKNTGEISKEKIPMGVSLFLSDFLMLTTTAHTSCPGWGPTELGSGNAEGASFISNAYGQEVSPFPFPPFCL